MVSSEVCELTAPCPAGQRVFSSFLEDFREAVHQEREIAGDLCGIERQNRRQDHRRAPEQGAHQVSNLSWSD